MWKHACAFVCTLGALALVTSSFIEAQSDTSTLPLLQFADLIYAGAFRLPDNTVNGDSFSIGGRPFAYNPARNSLFVGTHSGRLAEISIPAPSTTSNILALPFASFLQGFGEPTEGNLGQISTTDAAIDGLLVYGDRLFGTASIYYDANNTQRFSHYSRSTTLSAPSFTGWSTVWQADHTGFVSGFMALVPAAWQSKLGGPAITGQCCMPIAWRTSWGPSAFAWDPSHLGQVNPIPATPLLYYPNDHATLGHWNGANATYGGTTQINGLALVAGTRTALYFGRNGTGPFCYGNGTSVQSLVGTVGADGEVYCYDPTNPAKGQHAYPYNYQIWAYDLNDLAAVKAGTKQPWDVVPYGVWPFSFPFPEPQVRIGGVAYDSARQLIYVSQLLADQDGYGYRALIHVLRIGGAPGAPLPGPSTSSPPPAPSGSGKATSVTLLPDRAAPQAPGTTITWTATPVGGISPHTYKWWSYDGATWTPAGTWTSSKTFAWTPTVANSRYRVAVWVRSYGNNVDDQETSVAADYPISGTSSAAPPPPGSGTGRVSAVSIAPDRAAPQPPGTTITFTATPSGGVSPQQYKWWIFDGASWLVQSTWTASNTFTWTAPGANSNYRVAVWARSNGNTVDEQEASAAVDYPISAGGSGVTPAPAPSPTPSSSRATSVSLTTSVPSPQPPGATITWSATPVGGASPLQYKWWLFDGTLWTPVGSWTTSSTYSWTPATASANYRIGVWVRSNGNTVDAEETSVSMPFTIAGTVATAPPPSSSPTVTAVTIGSNRVAPQPPGITTTFTALAAGGTGPLQYKWWIFDGTLWVVQGGWTTSSTFTWTPGARNADYRIGVWVRSSGNTQDVGEVTSSIAFPVQ